MAEKQKVIVSLGGSIVAPDSGPDGRFVLQFAKAIKKLARGRQFFIVVGGGKINRNYNVQARSAGVKNQDDLDRIGLKATQLNAQFVATIFATKLQIQFLSSLQKPFKKDHVIISGGFPPLGKSTDTIAVQLAERIRAKKLINLSNIDYVYDRDPKKIKNAKRIENLTWQEFKKICGGEWKPGLNAPFDPIASKKAEQLGLEVIISNGRNLANFKRIVEGKAFKGTIINSRD